MKRRRISWRFHLSPLGVVSLLLLITALFAVLTSNWHELLRRAVILHLEDYTKSTVQLGSVTFDKFGHVTLNNLRIDDPTDAHSRPLLDVQRIDVTFDVLRLTALPIRPVGAIRRVAIAHPVISVSCDRTGRWNFETLLNHKNEPSADRFRGEVIVDRGEVFCHDGHGWATSGKAIDEHLVNLSARITTAGQQAMPFKLSAAFASGHGRVINLRGVLRTKDNTTECQIRFGKINVAFAQRFLKASLPFSMDAGSADGRWQLIVKKDPHTQRYTTEMSLLADVNSFDGKLKLGDKSLPCHINSGQIRFANDIVEFVGVKCLLNRVPMTLNGTISGFDDPVLTLQTEINHANPNDLVAVVPGLSTLGYAWHGNADGWAQLSGHARDLQVVGHISGISLRADMAGKPLTLNNLSSDIQYYDESVKLLNISGQAFNGNVAGSAWLSLAKPSGKSDKTLLLFQGSAVSVDAQEIVKFTASDSKQLTSALQGEPSGYFSGSIAIALTHAGKFSLTTYMHGPFQVGKYGKGTAEAAIQLHAGTGQQIAATFERVNLTLPYGKVYLHGTLNDRDLNINVQGSALDLAGIGKLFERNDLSGRGYLTGDITGSYEKPNFNGVIRAQNGRVAEKHFAELSSDIQFALAPSPHLMLKNIRLLSGGHQLEVSASELTATPNSGDWTKAQWHISQVNLSRSKLSSLAAMIGLKLQVDGFVEGNIEYADIPNGTQGKGRLSLIRPTMQLGVSRLDFDKVTVDFALRDAHTIDITDAKFSYERTPGQQSVISVTGSVSTDPKVSPDKQMDLHVVAEKLPIDNFVLFAGQQSLCGSFTTDARINLPVDLDGDISMSADINGQLVDGTNKTSPTDLLTRSLTIKGMVRGEKNFAIARVPYRQLEAVILYDHHANKITIPHFVLAPADGKRDYKLTLAAPSSITFSDKSELDLHFSLQGVAKAEDNKPEPADIASLHADLTAISDFTSHEYDGSPDGIQETASVTAKPDESVPQQCARFANYLREIPKSFNGDILCRFDVQQSITAPVLHTNVAISNLFVNNQEMPTLNADLSYDTTSRKLTFDEFVAKGGPDPNAELTVDAGSSITMPLRDAHGNEIEPGPMDIQVETQKVNPALFSNVFHVKGLEHLGGEINLTIFTLPGIATTTRPQFQASLDWKDPVINGVPLQYINATMTLENDADNPDLLRLWIGQRHVADGYATIHLKDANITDAPPLEISGYLPVKWHGMSGSPIPETEPFSLKVRMPDQKIQYLISEYFPKQADGIKGDGSVGADIRIGGTLRQPEFEDQSSISMRSPELILPIENKDLPNRLKDLTVDISLGAEHDRGRVTNVITVNDLSAFYDRADKVKPKVSLWDRIKIAMNLQKSKPEYVPSFVMQGTVNMPNPKGGWELTQGLSKQLTTMRELVRYDLYAKTINAPVKLTSMIDATITAYLHLGNDAIHPERPKLTGLLYAANSTVTYTGTQAAQVTRLQLPFDPELSLFMQIGKRNAFVLDPKNSALQGTVYAKLPLIPTGTQLFSPDAIADPNTKTASRAGQKPLIDEHPLHKFTADSYQPSITDDATNDSYGKITGSLTAPKIDFVYALEPNKSQVQLPGGLLMVQALHGTFHYDMGTDEPAKLMASGTATGTLDQYSIRANIDGNLLADSFKPDLSTASAPPGSLPLNSDDIYARLIGVPDIVSLIQGKQSLFSPVLLSKIGPNMYLSPWMRRLASAMKLNTFSVGFDSMWNPETTITTPTFAKSKWSSFQLGAKATLADSPLWRTWLNYSIPSDQWWLRNLAVTGEIGNTSSTGTIGRNEVIDNSKLKMNWGVQYTIPFTTK